MLDLRTLPEDVRDKVASRMFGACCGMDPIEPRAMRAWKLMTMPASRVRGRGREGSN